MGKHFEKRINELTEKPYVKQNKKCNRCHHHVFDTDVKEYDYVCLYHDENLYKCEVYDDKEVV